MSAFGHAVFKQLAQIDFQRGREGIETLLLHAFEQGSQRIGHFQPHIAGGETGAGGDFHQLFDIAKPEIIIRGRRSGPLPGLPLGIVDETFHHPAKGLGITRHAIQQWQQAVQQLAALLQYLLAGTWRRIRRR
jgi:hypothetical protein